MSRKACSSISARPAKAWCADRAAAAAAAATGEAVLVSLGGDVSCAGDSPASGWAVRVADDHRAGVDEPGGQTVQLTNGGLATSGTSVRQWTRGGRTMHHVIDPSTGLPAATHWRTVSVAAGSCADANIASTAAIVLDRAGTRVARNSRASGAIGRQRRARHLRRRLARAMIAAVSNGQALWFMTRATGLVALVLLTASVGLGVAEVTRWSSPRFPRFVTAALHKNISLLVVAFLAVHIITAIADNFAPIGWLDVVVPFHSPYRPLWLGLGAVAVDLLIALIVTSLLRARLGYRSWRAVHWIAYACWPVALLHSLGTGTDTRVRWALLLSLGLLAVVLASVAWRSVDRPRDAGASASVGRTRQRGSRRRDSRVDLHRSAATRVGAPVRNAGGAARWENATRLRRGRHLCRYRFHSARHSSGRSASRRTATTTRPSRSAARSPAAPPGPSASCWPGPRSPTVASPWTTGMRRSGPHRNRPSFKARWSPSMAPTSAQTCAMPTAMPFCSRCDSTSIRTRTP